ncbi:hypothetical protein CAC42_6783 [Sphaceloma murrayae]|uniref:AB hydrolase-1 domain-containing protein n=1 Tax=Sphaceloma murrayae TaxID=2082308 RepID=A0A2K1QH91_9PEZI|nr:hypothetical protein CAC42_6783 [Sphaceloma murrayae]
MGGSYDDAVVMTITETLLREDVIVCTFNFRGASPSSGTTSWTARPETDDYKSVIGLMVSYLHHLALGRSSLPTQHPLSSAVDPDPIIDLVLAGYSYGTLVLSLLGPIPDILPIFERAVEGSAAAEVTLRAAHLAESTLRVEAEMAHISDLALSSEEENAATTREGSRGRSTLSPKDALRRQEMVFGGEETSPDVRRRSQETGRRSLDVARRSMERVRKGLYGRGGVEGKESMEGKGERDRAGEGGGTAVGRKMTIRPMYLLVSPLLPPLSGVLSMSFSAMMPRKFGGLFNREGQECGAGHESLICHPTLVVFGSKDGFTSGKRLEEWCRELQERSGRVSGDKQDEATEGFRWLQVDSAGHFWREEGVADVLKKEIRGWARTNMK